MKIELWTKKIDKGHVKIGEVDVPSDFGYEYKMPVKMPVSVAFKENLTTDTSVISNYRSFYYTPSTERVFGIIRRYLEK